MSLIIRGILAIAGLVAALFVARESANFGLVQAAVGLLLVVAVVAVVVALRRRSGSKVRRHLR
jgi:uncharacterized membrane protein